MHCQVLKRWQIAALQKAWSRLPQKAAFRTTLRMQDKVSRCLGVLYKNQVCWLLRRVSGEVMTLVMTPSRHLPADTGTAQSSYA